MGKHRLATLMLAACLVVGVAGVCVLPAPTAYAEVQAIEADGAYIMGDSSDESFGAAREHAKEDAMRRASEKAGIYIESYSKTVKFVLTDDEVRTLASKVLDVQNVTYHTDDMTGRGLTIHCHIHATVDTVAVDDFIRDEQAHRSTASENMEHQNDALAAQLAQLQHEQEDLQLRADEERLRYIWNISTDEELDGLIKQVLARDPENKYALAMILFCTSSGASFDPAPFQRLCSIDPDEPIGWFGCYRATQDKAMLNRAVDCIHVRYTPSAFYQLVGCKIVEENILINVDHLDVYADVLRECMECRYGCAQDSVTYTADDGEDYEFLVGAPFYDDNKEDPFAIYFPAYLHGDVLYKAYH